MITKDISHSFGLLLGVVIIGLVWFMGPATADTGEREQAAVKVTGAFLEELGEAMTREMTKGGPMEAIKVCSELAPEIANRLSRENGSRVTRVGTRVRDPLLGMPDAWEHAFLKGLPRGPQKGKRSPA